MTAEVFLSDVMQGVSGFIYEELRALWMAKGGKPEHLRLAVTSAKSPYGFGRMGDEFCVVPCLVPGSVPKEDREPAPVSPLHAVRHAVRRIPPATPPSASPPPPPKMPEKGDDGVYHHGAFCDCGWCDEPIKPKYVRRVGSPC